jgi:hypothetical protein
MRTTKAVAGSILAAALALAPSAAMAKPKVLTATCSCTCKDPDSGKTEAVHVANPALAGCSGVDGMSCPSNTMGPRSKVEGCKTGPLLETSSMKAPRGGVSGATRSQ